MRRLASPILPAGFLLIGLLQSATAMTLPPRSVARPEHEIRDLFLAYIVGVVLEDHEIDTDGTALGELFPEFDDVPEPSDAEDQGIPFFEIARLRRSRVGLRVVIEIEFRKPLAIPVPVDILGYQPGTIYTSRSIAFEETSHESETLSSTYVMRRQSGDFGITLDGWLSALLGPRLSDFDAQILAFAELDDRWFGILGGETAGGGSIIGVYDLRRGRILIRPPRALRALGRQLLEP